jgi:hypothetical protein
MERSSRSGNEQMKRKIAEGGMSAEGMRSDFNAGENPWNGTRDVVEPTLYVALISK